MILFVCLLLLPFVLVTAGIVGDLDRWDRRKIGMMKQMENDDGVHRGTDQEVHGSAAGSSSGSQSTGTSITGTTTGGIPLYSGWSQYAGLGTLYTTSQGTSSQAITVPGSTPGYAFGQGYSGYLIQQAGWQHIPPSAWNSGGLTIATEQKKKIKDEGIRVGEIIAYRCWPIKNGFLWSTAAGRAWAPGEPMKAGENHLRDGLGVYAFKDMSRCIQEFGGESFDRGGVAFGSVVLWGEVVEHELGYRAEYAAVRSIEFVRNIDAQFWRPESVSNLRTLYKVEGK